MFFSHIYKAFKNMIYTRADENGCVFYYSSDDFEGLQRIPYPFMSSKGHKLQGYFYCYDGYKEGKIVLFEHGMGSGHRGYMKEIETLARHGYLVFSYDHTGCMESGGESTGGFVQSVIDADDALTALKRDERYKGSDFYVVGHSWGGFSTLNISAFHPEVKKIVAISGFVSVSGAISQFFGGILKGTGKRIVRAEREAADARYFELDAIKTLESSCVSALIIHSDDDKVLSCKAHFERMRDKLGKNENITFLKVTGKGHNPNYTADAVKYKDAFFAELQSALKKKQLVTDDEKKAFVSGYDWDRMTMQDGEVWDKIFAHLDM